MTLAGFGLGREIETIMGLLILLEGLGGRTGSFLHLSTDRFQTENLFYIAATIRRVLDRTIFSLALRKQMPKTQPAREEWGQFTDRRTGHLSLQKVTFALYGKNISGAHREGWRLIWPDTSKYHSVPSGVCSGAQHGNTCSNPAQPKRKENYDRYCSVFCQWPRQLRAGH